MRVHFIAIGGAVMHNLAIALKLKGYEITGSDDEIFEPSRTRLERFGLLPKEFGWDPRKITKDIDRIILGMHAREDNPELFRARELGIEIKSFPEYLYEETRDKKRIIVAGSHGKTTVTAMIMHVFKTLQLEFDYMVGSQIEGFDTMVGFSDNSEYAIFEGDEYLTSPIDKRPKFHLYRPDIAIINGISWDHMNVFPTMENYVEQFRIFIDKINPGGTLIYYRDDPIVVKIASESSPSIRKIPYGAHPHKSSGDSVFLLAGEEEIAIRLFGEHNMQNISAAKNACIAAGIGEKDFYRAISTFRGTAKRLQKIHETEKGIVYVDFAHSPSKVRATVDAIASRYPVSEIIACLELHTYSSLNSSYLPNYRDTLQKADRCYVYYSEHAVKLKQLPPVLPEEIKDAFGSRDLGVYTDFSPLLEKLMEFSSKRPVFLFMSSGSFDGQDMNGIAKLLLG